MSSKLLDGGGATQGEPFFCIPVGKVAQDFFSLVRKNLLALNIFQIAILSSAVTGVVG